MLDSILSYDTKIILLSRFSLENVKRWRSQNAEKEGRLLSQAVLLFNWPVFKTGTSLKGKNLLREGAISFLLRGILSIENHFYHIR